jgi:hypothetical protein
LLGPSELAINPFSELKCGFSIQELLFESQLPSYFIPNDQSLPSIVFANANAPPDLTSENY